MEPPLWAALQPVDHPGVSVGSGVVEDGLAGRRLGLDGIEPATDA
jgi:hypothetical protein